MTRSLEIGEQVTVADMDVVDTGSELVIISEQFTVPFAVRSILGQLASDGIEQDGQAKFNSLG